MAVVRKIDQPTAIKMSYYLPGGVTGSSFWRKLQAAKTYSHTHYANTLYSYACSFTAAVIEVYWKALQGNESDIWSLPEKYSGYDFLDLDETSLLFAQDLGELVARHDVVTAGYRIGEIYTSLLPNQYRSDYGVYYTPPALTYRLMTLINQSGVDWSNCSVLDPACGGGAFLAPVALTMVSALKQRRATAIIEHIATHLSGCEIDPFSAWVSQTLVEAALIRICREANRRLPNLVEVRDSVRQISDRKDFDVVIGNPPYGRVTLSKDIREIYQRSIYGHANLYGIFMDLATRLTRMGGVIAYITPTGFLGGEYFKSLREVMAKDAPPVAIDLITSRKGVFSDVLQETLLAVYRRGEKPHRADIYILSLPSETTAVATPAGHFNLPAEYTAPWLLPRKKEHTELVAHAREMKHRLSDYGYKISTGPLVWNRHKEQLCNEHTTDVYPIIWAESVLADGRFMYRADKKNHQPFLRPKRNQEWLLTRQSCVLVQRTTAKEQRRRLIAAVLPSEFINKYGAVSVENHLNMIRPLCDTPDVAPDVIALLLNSSVVDDLFRCISGSVAVSAAELESLPLPSPDAVQQLHILLKQGGKCDELDELIRELYLREEMYATS